MVLVVGRVILKRKDSPSWGACGSETEEREASALARERRAMEARASRLEFAENLEEIDESDGLDRVSPPYSIVVQVGDSSDQSEVT